MYQTKFNGFINVKRNIQLHEKLFMHDNDYKIVFWYLYLNAEYEDAKVVRFNKEEITLKRGEILISRHELAKKCDIDNERKVRTILGHFEKMGVIKRTPSPKGSLIYITIYNELQYIGNVENEQPTTSKRVIITEQPTTPKKNYNNIGKTTANNQFNNFPKSDDYKNKTEDELENVVVANLNHKGVEENGQAAMEQTATNN